MPLKPPFHKQETRYSCVPACLRMVLGSFGVDISESELRTRCDCTPYGTEALMAVDAARALGFVKTAKYTLSLAELQTVVTDGHYPIVFVDLNPIAGLDAIHAMVVADVSGQEVVVLDPLQGNVGCLSTSSPRPGRGATTSRCLWCGSTYAYVPTTLSVRRLHVCASSHLRLACTVCRSQWPWPLGSRIMPGGCKNCCRITWHRLIGPHPGNVGVPHRCSNASLSSGAETIVSYRATKFKNF